MIRECDLSQVNFIELRRRRHSARVITGPSVDSGCGVRNSHEVGLSMAH